MSSSIKPTGKIDFDGLSESCFALKISSRIILPALPAPTIRVLSPTSIAPASLILINARLKINLNNTTPTTESPPLISVYGRT